MHVDRAVTLGLASSTGIFRVVASMLVAIYEVNKQFGPMAKWVDDFFLTLHLHRRFTEANFMNLTEQSIGVSWSFKKLRRFNTVQGYLGLD